MQNVVWYPTGYKYRYCMECLSNSISTRVPGTFTDPKTSDDLIQKIIVTLLVCLPVRIYCGVPSKPDETLVQSRVYENSGTHDTAPERIHTVPEHNRCPKRPEFPSISIATELFTKNTADVLLTHNLL